MKKQVLIAAVAATMTSVAMADISITGGAKVNYTNFSGGTSIEASNDFKHDIDLTVKGQNGGTSVVMTVSNAETTEADDTSLTVENSYVTSKIGDVNVKMGQYQSTSDSMLSNATASTIEAGQFLADMTVGGVKVAYFDQNDSGRSITVSGEVAGVALSHKMANANAAGTNDYTDTKVSGSVAGIDLMYRVKDYDDANSSSSSDMDALTVSGTFNGVTATYAQAEADHASYSAISTDGALGEFTSFNNIKGFKLSTNVAGNTVAVASVAVEDTAGAVSDDYTKIVVTRPLASGATFEATYTDKDAASGAASDSETLDLELAVKF